MPKGIEGGTLHGVSLSPFVRKIPVWREEGWTLPDSSVICADLGRRVPSPSLYPSDARDFATSLFGEEYADTRLVESETPVFFQRIVRERVFKERADEEIVWHHLEEVLPPVLDQMEALFTGRDRANPADLPIGNLVVWSPFATLDHAGFELDASSWPGVASFLETLGAHPALKGLVEEERAALGTL